MNTQFRGGDEIFCFPGIDDQEFDRNFIQNNQGSLYHAAKLGGGSSAPDIIEGNTLACSVCETKRSTVIMIPARRTCPQGWQLEYEGVLMAKGRFLFVNRQSSTICVSLAFEPSFASQQRSNALDIFNVNILCDDGNLCDVNNNNFDVHCVVCTK